MTLAYSASDTSTPSLDAAMQRLGVSMTFAKGEEIFGQDEDADFLYAVIKGAVRTTRLQSDGRRQIGDFYYAGDLLGLETSKVHRFSAEALADCTLLAVKRTNLRAFNGDGVLDHAIWEATRRELERAQEHLCLLGRKTACEKVARFLLDIAERESGDDVALPMGRQDMADYLGLTIETVSRMVTQLQSARVVSFTGSRRFRVMGRQALERLAA